MKKIIVMLGMVCMFGGVANAASSSMIGVLESSITVKTVAVSSFSPTDMSANFNMPDRTMLVIQNTGASDLYCGATAAEVSAGNAFTVSAGGGSISLSIRTYSAKLAIPLKIFCLTSSTSGSTNAAVIQSY
jgi:hypothetical protein